MRILVHHQGQQLGPFTIEELRAALADGRIAAQDLAWWEGQASWVPVAAVPGLGMVASGGAAPVVTASGDGSGLAMSSLILGILSLIGCTFLTGIPAVICGHMALSRKSRAGITEGKGMAITGLVTGYAGTVLTLAIMAILAAIALPAFSQAKSQAQAAQSMNHARQIGFALITYSSDHEDAYPATLEDLDDQYLPDKSVLVDPLAPGLGENGYIYIAPSRNDPPNKVVLVSRGKTSRGERAVGRKDGTVTREKYSLPADL
jgi:type II secretory pathway pseudopilin PulG